MDKNGNIFAVCGKKYLLNYIYISFVFMITNNRVALSFSSIGN